MSETTATLPTTASTITHPKKPNTMMSEATRAVLGMFRQLIESPDMTISRDELSAAIGEEVKPGSITTAVRHMRRDHNITVEWDRISKVYHRSVGEDNLIRRAGDFRSIRRKSRIAREKIATSGFENMSDEQKIRACAYSSVFGVMARLGESSSIKKIENHVTKANVDGIPIGNTLSLFNEQAVKVQAQQGPQNGVRPQS
jgi:hypothetical protein